MSSFGGKQTRVRQVVSGPDRGASGGDATSPLRARTQGSSRSPGKRAGGRPSSAGEHGRPTWAAQTSPLQPRPTSSGRGGPCPHRHQPPQDLTPGPRGTLGFGSSALRRPAGTSGDLQGPGIRAPGCTAQAHSATPSRRTAAHTRHPYGNRCTTPRTPETAPR